MYIFYIQTENYLYLKRNILSDNVLQIHYLNEDLIFNFAEFLKVVNRYIILLVTYALL